MNCERCNRNEKNVGPWDGTGGFGWLCGTCKIKVTLASPEHRAKLAATLKKLGEHLSKEENKPSN